MGVGKKKARGPIAKAIKNGEGIEKGLEKAATNYQTGVGSAGDAWVAGTAGFLGYFMPRVLEYYDKVKDTVKDPYERMRLVLKEESKIARDYDVIARENRIKQEIESAKRSGTPIGVSPLNPMSTGTTYPTYFNTTSATKKITI
jgi:hypothetical protein